MSPSWGRVSEEDPRFVAGRVAAPVVGSEPGPRYRLANLALPRSVCEFLPLQQNRTVPMRENAFWQQAGQRVGKPSKIADYLSGKQIRA